MTGAHCRPCGLVSFYGAPSDRARTPRIPPFDRRAVQIGTKTATALIDDPPDITTYETLFDNLERLAVFDDDAHAALRRMAAEYRALSEEPGMDRCQPGRALTQDRPPDASPVGGPAIHLAGRSRYTTITPSTQIASRSPDAR